MEKTGSISIIAALYPSFPPSFTTLLLTPHNARQSEQSFPEAPNLIEQSLQDTHTHQPAKLVGQSGGKDEGGREGGRKKTGRQIKDMNWTLIEE